MTLKRDGPGAASRGSIVDGTASGYPEDSLYVAEDAIVPAAVKEGQAADKPAAAKDTIPPVPYLKLLRWGGWGGPRVRGVRESNHASTTPARRLARRAWAGHAACGGAGWGDWHRMRCCAVGKGRQASPHHGSKQRGMCRRVCVVPGASKLAPRSRCNLCRWPLSTADNLDIIVMIMGTIGALGNGRQAWDVPGWARVGGWGWGRGAGGGRGGRGEGGRQPALLL